MTLDHGGPRGDRPTGGGADGWVPARTRVSLVPFWVARVSRLNELRTTLVSAAITGKIDVRSEV